MTTHTGSITHDGLGEMLRPGDPGYDEARHVWNGTIDRFPALIARCRTTEEVAAAVRMANVARLEIAVRGRRPQHPRPLGLRGRRDDRSVAHEGDRGRRRPVHRPGAARPALARVRRRHAAARPGQPRRRDLPHRRGRAHPRRRDRLAVAPPRTRLRQPRGRPGGPRRRLDHRGGRGPTDPDLLWGLRGGGGNFGIVTELRFRVHPVAPLYSGMLIWPAAEAHEVLGRFTEAWDVAPRDFSLVVAASSLRHRRRSCPSICSSSPWSRSPRCGPATPPIRSPGRRSHRSARCGPRPTSSTSSPTPASSSGSTTAPLTAGATTSARSGSASWTAARSTSSPTTAARGVVAVQPGARPAPRWGDRRRGARRDGVPLPRRRVHAHDRIGVGGGRRRAPRRVDPTLVGAAAPLELRGRLREPPRGRRGARPGARRLRAARPGTVSSP